MFPQQRTKAPHRNALIGMTMFNKNLSDTETEEEWYLDSGCNSHMTLHIKYFSQYTPYTSSNNLIKIGDGRLLEATGIGDIQVIVTVKGEIIESVLKNVLYVPELHLNLFSLGVCMEKGYSVQGEEDIIYLKKNDKLYVEAIKNKNVFVINMKVDTRENCEENNLLAGYASGIRSIQDWHERLAHQNFQHVRSLLKSLNIEFKDDENAFCEYCLQGKQCRQPFRISTTEVNELCNTISADLCGPTERSHEHLIKNKRIRSNKRLPFCEKPSETENNISEQQDPDLDLEEIELSQCNEEEMSQDSKEDVVSDTTLVMSRNTERLQRSRAHVEKSRQGSQTRRLKFQSRAFHQTCLPNENIESIETVQEVKEQSSSDSGQQISFIDTPSTSQIPNKTKGRLPRIFQALLSLWRKPSRKSETEKKAEN
ncbi:hypothetical protein ILUMI_08571 [Ignelater luminosus]|uniref:GAG-pre-integrase domain-containing protein n=1 Tax=Ignelater luminosus TaxID=2038154 RepID=A0A8K0D5W1_IGNLU|nr:hypothetical protein ILUMI_08571 [Ignelater luminosus]